MKSDCLICQRIQLIKQGRNPYFVTELETGYVVIGDHQFYQGYTLLLYKQHSTELHQLNSTLRQQFLNDMAITAEAVYQTFQPDKLNYELLGNGHPHLHWHLIPRRHTDPKPTQAIWTINKSTRTHSSTAPSSQARHVLVQKLKTTLNNLKKFQKLSQ